MRLAVQVRDGIARTGQSRRALARRTGIPDPVIAAMLSGARGTRTEFAVLIEAAESPALPAPPDPPEYAANNRGWQRW